MSSRPLHTAPGRISPAQKPYLDAPRARLFYPQAPCSLVYLAALFGTALLTCGCTPLTEYIHNGFKVGPNYHKPPAPVEKDWIEASDPRVHKSSDDLSQWWDRAFHDPVLNSLVCYAYKQNLTLRQAGFRVLQARAQLGVDVGNLFPQTQKMFGDYTRNALSVETANNKFFTQFGKRFYSQWDFGFNLSWELDFWGRFRRAIESDEATLDASIENYDAALVTLIGDIATNYIQMRTTEERIRYAEENVKLQEKTLQIVEARFKAGTVTEIDPAQARSTLEQTQATIPELQIALRQYTNQLCILLGIAPEDLRDKLGPGRIPTAVPEVAVGIPADLLRRRPDVRRAERQAAAQSAQIGVAESEFYPHIAINGTLEYSAERFRDLFNSKAFSGTIGPAFQWNILNFGRILNNVRLQDAKFQEAVAAYQQAVLTAQQEAENGLVTFLRAQERTKYQTASVNDTMIAVRIVIAQFGQPGKEGVGGIVDLTRVTQLQLSLVQQQDVLAQARGEVALGLVQVYKALGGGWQLRCTDCEPAIPLLQETAPVPVEVQVVQPQEVQPVPPAAPNMTPPAAAGSATTAPGLLPAAVVPASLAAPRIEIVPTGQTPSAASTLFGRPWAPR